MAEGYAELDRMIASLRALEGLAERAAERAAPLVEGAVRATAAAGTTPEGQAWAPKKKGGRALANAASAVTARALGAVIQVTLTGVYVYHQKSKGLARPIIPGGADIPPTILAAIKRGAAEAFREITGTR